MNLDEKKARIRATLVSIIAGVAILALKFIAYFYTGSAALKSDAYESMVNVVAAIFALGAIIFAEQPADQDHPYGHGKIENFSAAFEGGLITLAAMMIVYEGVHSLLFPTPIKELDLGLGINILAGFLNGLLGFFLIRKGRSLRSRAIEADGHHVMSDFITSIALAVGVGVVWLSGWEKLDPILAITMGLWLFYVGFKLVRDSASALLDVEDPQILQALAEAANAQRMPEVITLHGLRTMRSGRYTHADVHVVVPEHMQVRQIHDLVEEYFSRVLTSAKVEGEFHSHIDPCMKLLCSECQLSDCPNRKTPFVEIKKFEITNIILPDSEVK